MKKIFLILFLFSYIYAEDCNTATNRVNFYLIKAKQQMGVYSQDNWCKVEYCIFKAFEANKRAKEVCGNLFNDQFLVTTLETYKISQERCKKQKELLRPTGSR